MLNFGFINRGRILNFGFINRGGALNLGFTVAKLDLALVLGGVYFIDRPVLVKFLLENLSVIPTLITVRTYVLFSLNLFYLPISSSDADLTIDIREHFFVSDFIRILRGW